MSGEKDLEQLKREAAAKAKAEAAAKRAARAAAQGSGEKPAAASKPEAEAPKPAATFTSEAEAPKLAEESKPEAEAPKLADVPKPEAPKAVAAEAGTASSSGTSDDLAKKKAAAVAKAKAAAAAKRKAMELAGGAGADQKADARADAPAGDDAKAKAAAAAKAKAAAAAKAKAAAAAKAKATREGGADAAGVAATDEEKAKAIAAAKAKAAAVAKAKAAAAAKGGAASAGADESAAETPVSPNQAYLDKYVKVIEENMGSDSLEDFYINKLSKDVPTLVVKRKSYFKLAQFLKYNELLGFDYLSEQHGTDFETHLEIYVHLFSYRNRQSVAVRVKIDRDDPTIESLQPIWAGADWPECEMYDLLGINFTGHPNLHRIFLGEDWVGHPLRKDYQPYDVEV